MLQLSALFSKDPLPPLPVKNGLHLLYYRNLLYIVFIRGKMSEGGRCPRGKMFVGNDRGELA